MSQALAAPADKPHLLIVDDDERMRGLLRRYLVEQGYVVTTASGAGEAKAVLRHFAYDLMVLDVMMPGESGLDLTRFLRQGALAAASRMPILLLTARGQPSDRIEGFEVGADDYLSKPFEPRELSLRIQAILRRLPAQPTALAPSIQMGRWRYDLQRDELSDGAQTLRLTGMEASLMRALALQPGLALSREALAERARSDKGVVNDRTVDVQVTRLRRKIEADAKNPRYLVTVRGQGYMLLPDVEP